MSISEEKNTPTKYWYYDYLGNIAREVVGNNECASNRFYFYTDGKWINDYTLSLHLSDATHDCCCGSVWDYEELTEEEAMRRVAEQDKKYGKKD